MVEALAGLTSRFYTWLERVLDGMSASNRMTPDTPSTSSWWDNLTPGPKAAISVGIVVVFLEFLSDALPIVGFIITIPIAIVLYYFQGMLAGRFLRHDRRFPGAGPGHYIRSGAISAFWTAVVISTAMTLIDTAILAPLTVGVILAALPLTLASGLVDAFLNFAFTILGAWLYSRFSGSRLVGVSCGVMAGAIAAMVLVTILATGWLVVNVIHLLHNL